MLKNQDFHVKTLVIKKKHTFDNLFKGFRKAKVISYVVSPDLLIKKLEEDFDEIEIVIGEDISKNIKEQLSKKSFDYTLKLWELVKNNKLKIFIPKKMIHTKLYILESKDKVRVIQSSANFTNDAFKANQINYCWFIDFESKNSPLLTTIYKDYKLHKDNSTLFMEDLIKLMSEDSFDNERKVKIWLNNKLQHDDGDSGFIKNITDEALGINKESNELDQKSSLISIDINEKTNLNNRRKNYLKGFDYQKNGNTILIDRVKFLDHEIQRIPLMRVDKLKQRLVLGISGKVISRTNQDIDPKIIRESLLEIENYINTVNLGISTNHLMTKMNMFESLLYIFSCPFFNEYMIRRRGSIGEIDLRGPRFLYLYGPSSNGKTTFLIYVLKLISKYRVLPIPGSDLKKHIILDLSSKSTCFPLIFDDIPSNKWNKGSAVEDLMKKHWEINWDENKIFPQVIFSSNDFKLKKWAQTRVKQVIFDVHFTRNTKNQKKLQDLFRYDNEIYTYFTKLYMDKIDSDAFEDEDELKLAREVYKELYSIAELPLPEFFPRESIEKVWDFNKIHWRDLIEHFKKAKIRKIKKEVYIVFDKDIRSDISDYLSHLPQNIKSDRKGDKVRIDNPADLYSWLYGKKDKKIFSSFFSFIKRIFT